MHEPGPPRTTSVGEAVELAPRSVDPSGTYRWTVRDAPAESALSAGDRPDPNATGPPSSATAIGSVGAATPPGASSARVAVLRAGETSRDDDPVVHLAPDVSGTYVLALDAPDGVHRQRVRVFPDERRETEIRVSAADLSTADPSVDDGEVDRVSLRWSLNENRLARDRAERDGDDWVASVRVPPGSHGFGFAPDDDRSAAYHGVCEVPGPGRPRVSLDATVVEGEGSEESDRLRLTASVEPAPAVDDVERGGDPDALDATFLVDDRDADPETVAAIESRADGRTLSVPLDDLPSPVRIRAVPHGERYGAAETVRIEATGDRSAVEAGADGVDPVESVDLSEPNPTPEWAASPTIYEVFVRSFAGDTLPTTFAEIERRVEYLESLGVDALWLTPVLASPTDHGYHVTDYYDTADDLGSRESFESLVGACHDAGIRVVFDLVINHTSRDHPAFQLHAAGVDAYADHYRRTDAAADVTGIDWAELGDGDVPDYYFDWGRIPNLNYDSPAVREWLLDVIDEWAGVVDGLRADVAWGVPHGFWKEVADRVPDDVLLLDETLPHDPFYGEGEFHRHYDTSLYETLRAVGAGEEAADAVETALARGEWLGFGDQRSQMRYVENHDEDRYLAEHGRDALRAAAAVTFTLPGAPMIYAGQERGNETYRGPIRWHDGDNDLTDFHRALAALRDAEPTLREGAVDFDGRAADVRVVEGDAERVTAYERTPAEGGEDGGDDSLLVVVNFGANPATVAVPDSVETDLFGDGPVHNDADESASDAHRDEVRVAVDAVAVLR